MIILANMFKKKKFMAESQLQTQPGFLEHLWWLLKGMGSPPIPPCRKSSAKPRLTGKAAPPAHWTAAGAPRGVRH